MRLLFPPFLLLLLLFYCIVPLQLASTLLIACGIWLCFFHSVPSLLLVETARRFTVYEVTRATADNIEGMMLLVFAVVFSDQKLNSVRKGTAEARALENGL